MQADYDPARHVVSPKTVEAWCASKGGIPHFLVSAKTGMNVDDAYMTVVKAAQKRVKPSEPMLDASTLKLNLPPPTPASGCSC